MTKHPGSENPKRAIRKYGGCLNALVKLKETFGLSPESVLLKTLLRKMGKFQVIRNRKENRSKVCAGNTCTPCEGFATPSTPHEGADVQTHRPKYSIPPISVETTLPERMRIASAARRVGLSPGDYVRERALAGWNDDNKGETHV